LADLADRLEKLWSERGQPVDLNELLPPPGDPKRLLYLEELIRTDLEIRWRRRIETRIDWYIERFEELGKSANVSPKLIYEEYRVRQKFGDKPDLASFNGRFPNQYAEVLRIAKGEPLPTTAPAISMPSAHPPISTGPRGSSAISVSGDYHLLKRLGAGAFGEVWLAEAPGGIEVAVKKIYKPVDNDADEHELKALEHIKNLKHPFLLGTHAYWITPDRYLYIAMELADNTMRDRLKECRDRGLEGVPQDELLRVMNQAAQALDYVHTNGLFHRDIKPDNILVMSGFAKVGDFGLVRNQGTLNVESAGGGTLAYMAPECFAGSVNRYSDQYSLAISYVELRTGRRPFPPRENQFDCLLDHKQGTPDLSALDTVERPIVERALAKVADQRFPNCLAFVAALEKALRPEPPPPASPRPESWLEEGKAIGKAGYLLQRRRAHTQAVGQLWDALAPDGKRAVLRVIDNLDLIGADKYLFGYYWQRFFIGMRNVLQVQADWLVDTAGALVNRAEAAKFDAGQRLALVVILEWFEDGDLSVRFSGSGSMLDQAKTRDLLLYLHQAAEAIDLMNSPTHSYRGLEVAIRHCAIRPENLLLAGENVKISDFSMAQADTDSIAWYKHDISDIGPAGYAAPELQVKGDCRVTDRSDQYSLAMTYVKLRTGTLPFDQLSHYRIIDLQLEGKLNFRNLPEAERPVIARATSRRPEDRYPNCVAFIEALETVLQSHPT
jgi:serine/threonine protein kinase